MGAFVAACLAFIVLGAGGFFALSGVQQSTGAAFTTGGTRIDPSWSWRAQGDQSCEPRPAWELFFVDFGTPKGEAKACSASQ